MKFGYTIVYVDAVADTLAFYKQAFGFETRFLHESGDYGELGTGATVLALAYAQSKEGSLFELRTPVG
jgi:lactoylglutathione lyase